MQSTPYVDQMIAEGTWREEVIPADVVGLPRPMTVLRATRKNDLIVTKWHGNADTFCPPIWSDLAIGSGSCGALCRACYLLLTFRDMRDPRRHVLYDNGPALVEAAHRWLSDPLTRMPKEQRRTWRAHVRQGHSVPQRVAALSVGIDRSDSLLYEGVCHHVRNLAPLFGDPDLNATGHKLVLLTKTANVRYLAEIAPEHRHNIVVTFSLNPNRVMDAWEGKYDDGVRITPPAEVRLAAAKQAQDLGFEIRARLDPILTVTDWEAAYAQFITDARQMGVHFRLWTLGTYREKNDQLATFAARWGLPPIEWEPSGLEQDGTHWHLPAPTREGIYRTVIGFIRAEYRDANIGLCKETHAARRSLLDAGLSLHCNCLPCEHTSQ
jgi:hypothetical protein